MGKLLGSSPLTTIIGIILAGLTAAQTLLQAGQTNWLQIVSAVLIAVFGRLAADSNTVAKK